MSSVQMFFVYVSLGTRKRCRRQSKTSKFHMARSVGTTSKVPKCGLINDHVFGESNFQNHVCSIDGLDYPDSCLQILVERVATNRAD